MTPPTFWPVHYSWTPVFGMNCLRRRRERRIVEGSNGDRHHFPLTVGRPVHRRPAIGAEAEGSRISSIL
jgi:hypothetical protein